jgi:DNA-binding Lrp family transcriptional regulator
MNEFSASHARIVRKMPHLRDLGALDQFDLKLLAALEADGRLTNAELAEKIGLSASQCSRRRIRLEKPESLRAIPRALAPRA